MLKWFLGQGRNFQQKTLLIFFFLNYVFVANSSAFAINPSMYSRSYICSRSTEHSILQHRDRVSWKNETGSKKKSKLFKSAVTLGAYSHSSAIKKLYYYIKSLTSMCACNTSTQMHSFRVLAIAIGSNLS